MWFEGPKSTENYSASLSCGGVGWGVTGEGAAVFQETVSQVRFRFYGKYPRTATLFRAVPQAKLPIRGRGRSTTRRCDFQLGNRACNLFSKGCNFPAHSSGRNYLRSVLRSNKILLQNCAILCNSPKTPFATPTYDSQCFATLREPVQLVRVELEIRCSIRVNYGRRMSTDI